LIESEIILGCQEGKAIYQKELVVRYSPMLMTVCRRYARDQESAKDVLQESMIKIFRYIHKYKPIGSFQAWMRRICINTALQSLDKSCFKREISGLDELIAQPFSMPDVYSYLGTEELMVIIEQLPDGFKQVFNLVVIEGFSHREVSEVMGITESTSRSQLVRARNFLKKMLVKRDRIRV
jgi:RNA polymerase sigma factor (sigma-70 family)